METLLDVLAGCRWGLLPVLGVLVACYFVARARGRAELHARILENEQGAKCPHGKWKYRLCRSCAEEFCRQDLQDEPDQVDQLLDQVDEDLEDDDADGQIKASFSTNPYIVAPIVTAAATFFGGPAAGAAIAAASSEAARIPSRPGWLVLDVPRSDGHVELEIWTNAKWPGCAQEIGVLTDRGLTSWCANIPASISAWREHLTMRYGPGIRRLLIPDHDGIDRIKLIINGCHVVDVPPSVLRALQK